MIIRPARIEDEDAIWAVLEPIIRSGEYFAVPRDMGKSDAIAFWRGSDSDVYVMDDAGIVLGTYYIRPNQRGGGAHVANGGYATAADAQHRGIARAMCQHSLEVARSKGFRAMQFNFVVSTNERAVRLWKKLGFEVVGTLPGAFVHPEQGDVDVLVMFRIL